MTKKPIKCYFKPYNVFPKMYKHVTFCYIAAKRKRNNKKRNKIQAKRKYVSSVFFMFTNKFKDKTTFDNKVDENDRIRPFAIDLRYIGI